MNEETLKNGLYCRLDWLEFTVDCNKSDYPTFLHYIEKFGFFADTFDDTERGGIGYTRCFRHVFEGIYVYFAGNSDMGIHFKITGTAVNFFLDTYLAKYKCDTPFGIGYDVGNYDATFIAPMLFEYILSIGHFTRIDLAVDDLGCNYFSCTELVNLVVNRQCVCKFRQWKNVLETTTEGVKLGHTVYFGSRQSDVFLRVYDKALEQDIKNIPWVRWELELKAERADMVAKSIIEKNACGSVAVGILTNYMRLVKLDNERRCRCPSLDKWIDFISDCSSVSLSLAPRESSIDKKVQWIDKQVKPTIAGLLTAFDGDMTFLTDNLNVAFDRLNYRDKQLFLNFSGGGKNDL